MLGIGRALGETIAVYMIINTVYSLNWHVLQSGGNSIAAMIAGLWSSASANQLSRPDGGGLVLFAITLTVQLAGRGHHQPIAVRAPRPRIKARGSVK